MVLVTEEVRWFYQGTVSSDLRSWFLGLTGPLTPEPLRVDHYLLIRDTDALGIKFREGRIEVKQRFGSPRRVAFGPERVGSAERWRKWGFSLASATEARTYLEELDTWIAVEKARLSRDYRLDTEGRLKPLEEPDLSIPTCSVELTEVHAAGQTAWTLAFEAAGPTQALAQTLEQVARQILGAEIGKALLPEDSYGYARWLQIMHA